MSSAECGPFRLDRNVIKDMSPLSQNMIKSYPKKWTFKDIRAYLSIAMKSDRMTDTLYVAISNIRYSWQNTMLFEKVIARLPM